MKRIDKTLLLISLFIGISACRDYIPEFELTDYSIRTHAEPIKIDVEDTKPLILSEIACNISYIILETKPEATIGSVDKIIKYKDLYFIADMQKGATIYSFDSSGKYLFKIQNKGRGPGEYIGIDDFDINRDKELIIIYDRSGGGIFEYDLSGSFVKKYPVDLVFESFRHLEGTTLLAYSKYMRNPSLPQAENSSIFTFNYQNIKRSATYATFDDKFLLFQKVFKITDNICSSNGSFYIYDFYLNSFFSFINDSLAIRWVIDYGKNNIPNSFWSSSDFISLQNGIVSGRFAGGFENFQVVGDWIIGVYGYRKNMNKLFYNHKSGHQSNVSNMIVNDLVKGFPEIVGFPLVLMPPYHSDGENIISVIEPAWINKIINQGISQIDVPDIISDLDIYSNPVLQIIKLK